MRKQNQKGIATAEIVLFAIIFVLIGFIGWYVMKQNKDSNKAATTSESTSSTKTNAASSGQVFQFKELGVQFVLPEDLKGLTYDAQPVKDDSGQSAVVLYLHESDQQSKDLITACYGKDEPNADGIEFGAIGKASGKYKTPAADQGPSDPLLKQFDGFYITFGFPNGLTSCSESNIAPDSVQSMASKLSTSFTSAFQTTAAPI